ncbi:MAG: flagellin FliC [Nitrospina sp.]|jgi:flagellin|nr:flagellin FliC [Nitrospina sp.]MBT6738801.1 flagellin FliC [Nitrospina sp.]MBT7195773.1 flagellin FliC [Nitrospina sp.]MBT7681139.1 flagellin FliC [Nitrospina sp.]MBT7707655.1 flagellin FliC [Nitrospina sp.]
MANSILNNTLSNTAQRYLGTNFNRVGQSIVRVSFGTRINKASDDIAGLAISEALRSDIRALRQGARNLNDGVSLLNVVEGGLNEQAGAVIRIKELATQGSSGTIGDFERRTLQLEVSSLVAEIDRIAATTKFNGKGLLDGALSKSVQVSQQLSIQIGINGQDASRINLNTELDQGASNSSQLGLRSLLISTQEGAQSAITQSDEALKALNDSRGKAGAVQNRFSKALGTLGVSIESLTQADSTIRDADIAEEIAILTRNQIVASASVNMVGQSNLTGQNLLSIL